MTVVAIETVVLSPSDPVVFGWWCVGHLALLYCSSEEGREVEGRGLVPHWDLVHHLLPLTFRQVSVSLFEERKRSRGPAGSQ